MGTMLTVTVWGRDSIAMLDAVRAARDSVRLVDSLMSVYRPESEISRVNRSAGGAPVAVSPQTLRVLLQARRLWRLSGGMFDPTVGPLVEAWGFYGDSGRIPPRQQLDSLRRLVGYERVEIDSAKRTVRLAAARMRLDLGGIAKGHALDMARIALAIPAVTGGMVDLGGNVLVFGRPPRGARWVIGIRHPRKDGSVIGTVVLDSGAVATSGDYENFYTIGGVRYAHVIDPTTGYPKQGVIAASAIGPRGEWSDGVSATFLLVGPVRGSAIADSLESVGGIWILDNRGKPIDRSNVVLSAKARASFAASWPRSRPIH
jgi:thiamine biosynthesis lipoprotein